MRCDESFKAGTISVEAGKSKCTGDCFKHRGYRQDRSNQESDFGKQSEGYYRQNREDDSERFSGTINSVKERR